MSETTQRTRSSELAELRERLARSEGKRYWRSLDELAENPEFMGYLHREFPEQASELVDPVSRRRFLHLMGASIALAGATACSNRTPEKILPYVRQPEEIVPGIPLHFASTGPRGGYGVGVVVESHMGRPTKIEGNREHPASLGASDPFLQAEMLVLYDPDRSETVVRNGRISTWESFLATATTALATQDGSGGAGLRILTETVTSPTLTDQIRRLTERFPNARWHQYEPVGRHAAHRGGLAAFGEPVHVHYDLSRADVVLTLDADLFAGSPGSIRYTREFADRRRVRADKTDMVRLYAVESAAGLSGAMADHRWRMKASQVETFARALAAELGVPGLRDGATAIESFLALGTGVEREWITELAADLRAGVSVVVPGEEQSPAVHALAHAINASLGRIGDTMIVTDPVAAPDDQLESIAELADAMRSGSVEMLLIVGGNPAYDAPADLDFVGAMQSVPTCVHLGLYQDETAEYCHWHVPAAHWLESWGDARAYDGTISMIQPLIDPIAGGRSAIELFGALLGESGTGLDLVRAYWRRQFESGAVPRGDAADFERFWRRALHDGVVRDSAAAPRRPSLTADWDAGPSNVADGIEAVFRSDPTILDGRYANNGWLQEAPKPLTKLTWDNAVLMSPATAEHLGVDAEQNVIVRAGDRSVTGPVWIVPGQADDTVVLHLGYGRRRVGRVGRGTGFDAYPLRTADSPWFVGGVVVEPAAGSTRLASTQHHHSMEGRDLARVGDIGEFRETGEIHHPHTHEPTADESLYPEWEYPGHSWAMTIDLNVCTGCNGCLTACQAENNIPVVGKEQVLNGREMHWIRVDRYWAGGIDDPETVFQPLTCMHCENAPCEVVCPVAATVHGSEGLNEMVYNRCVGTRYCANNCPYKVRRFNFLEYTEYEETPVLKMLQNPDVTVRSRGVMEKCTYCVQRINGARQSAKVDGRELQDGDVVTACMQACPAGAIVFGDMNDPDSEISRVRAEPLHYGVLTELGTRPRTNYLPKLRNRNPAIHDAVEVTDVH